MITIKGGVALSTPEWWKELFELEGSVDEHLYDSEVPDGYRGNY